MIIDQSKMLSIVLVCTILVLISSNSAAALERPKFIKKCVRNDPDFARCWRQGLEQLRPYLVRGIPEFNAPSIDPLKISRLKLHISDNTGVYDLLLKDMSYRGARDFKVIDNTFDFDGLNFKLTLRFPKIFFRTHMKVNGTLLGFTIDSTDALGLGEFDNMIINLKASGAQYTKGGKTYINWQENSSDFSYGKEKFKSQGLFKSPDLESIFNTAINVNADLVYSQFITIIRYSFGSYLLEILNRFHKAYPIDVLYGAN